MLRECASDSGCVGSGAAYSGVARINMDEPAEAERDLRGFGGAVLLHRANVLGCFRARGANDCAAVWCGPAGRRGGVSGDRSSAELDRRAEHHSLHRDVDGAGWESLGEWLMGAKTCRRS